MSVRMIYIHVIAMLIVQTRKEAITATAAVATLRMAQCVKVLFIVLPLVYIHYCSPMLTIFIPM